MRFKTISGLLSLVVLYSSVSVAGDVKYHYSGNKLVGKFDTSIYRSNGEYIRESKYYTYRNGSYTFYKSFYACFNGNGTPYTNFSQSWATTQSAQGLSCKGIHEDAHSPYKNVVSYKKVNGYFIRETKKYETTGNSYKYKSSDWECFVGHPQDPVEFGGKNGGRNWYSTGSGFSGCAEHIKNNSGS